MGTRPELTRRWRLASACLASVLVVLALASFSAPARATGSVAVSIAGFAFNPRTVTLVIGVNNTVTWTNNDATSHTVTSDNSLFDSGTLAPHATFTHTFDQAGTYGYHCSIHTSMTGTVHVVSLTPTTTTTSSSSVSSSSTSTISTTSSSSLESTTSPTTTTTTSTTTPDYTLPIVGGIAAIIIVVLVVAVFLRRGRSKMGT